jgi:hypothetical protein
VAAIGWNGDRNKVGERANLVEVRRSIMGIHRANAVILPLSVFYYRENKRVKQKWLAKS